MQISALSFSVCVDHTPRKFDELLKLLNTDFRIRYNTDLELYTVRYFKPETIQKLSRGRIILLEQLSRNTAQLVLK